MKKIVYNYSIVYTFKIIINIHYIVLYTLCSPQDTSARICSIHGAITIYIHLTG